MLEKSLNNIFGNSENQSKKRTAPPKGRKLQIESLESREMLSISPADYDSIRALYPDLNLAASMGSYNVIEITSNELTDAKLRAAIATASTTTKNDLIVVRTTAAQNKITLGGTELAISTSKGSVTIVSFGEKTLTLDANYKSRVVSIGKSSTVNIGGIVTQTVNEINCNVCKSFNINELQTIKPG